MQYTDCQNYDHTRKYCNRSPASVKCAGNYDTKVCKNEIMQLLREESGARSVMQKIHHVKNKEKFNQLDNQLRNRLKEY